VINYNKELRDEMSLPELRTITYNINEERKQQTLTVEQRLLDECLRLENRANDLQSQIDNINKQRQSEADHVEAQGKDELLTNKGLQLNDFKEDPQKKKAQN
jgi:hypothetical protein